MKKLGIIILFFVILVIGTLLIAKRTEEIEKGTFKVIADSECDK